MKAGLPSRVAPAGRVALSFDLPPHPRGKVAQGASEVRDSRGRAESPSDNGAERLSGPLRLRQKFVRLRVQGNGLGRHQRNERVPPIYRLCLVNTGGAVLDCDPRRARTASSANAGCSLRPRRSAQHHEAGQSEGGVTRGRHVRPERTQHDGARSLGDAPVRVVVPCPPRGGPAVTDPLDPEGAHGRPWVIEAAGRVARVAERRAGRPHVGCLQ